MDGSNISDTFDKNDTYLNIREANDPMILATSYTMYKIGDFLKRYYFPVLVPTGIVGNVLSFLVMIQPNNRHMSLSLYICALAVADTIAILDALVSYLQEIVGVAMPPNQRWYCILQVFFNFSSFLCSAYVLIAMTFERFYSILRPLKAASFNTVKRARIIITCIYLAGFLYCVPYFFIAGNDGKFCIPNLVASDNVFGELYNWLTEVLNFVVPFVSLLTMNSGIIHTLRKRSKQKFLESTDQGESVYEKVKIKHSEKQIFTMLLLVTFAFLILNIPTRALVFYLNFASGGDTPFHYAGFHLFYQIGDKSYVTNHGINFFLYVLSGQKFRTDLKNLFFSKQLTKTTLSNVTNIASRISSDVAS